MTESPMTAAPDALPAGPTPGAGEPALATPAPAEGVDERSMRLLELLLGGVALAVAAVLNLLR